MSKFLTLVLLFGAAICQAQNMTYSFLKEIIVKNDIRSIEDLMSLLPEEFRSEYVLMYSSQSPQNSSFEAPRVILFGPDGEDENRHTSNLTMAYSGKKIEGKPDTLEIIEFSDKENRFQFRAIDFDSFQKPTFRDTPVTCMKCHSENEHPIWDTYDLWPGAYSGDHLAYGVLPQKAERQGLTQFFQAQKKNPRYKHLRYLFDDNADMANNLKMMDAMNVRLTYKLADQNYRRIAQQLVQSSKYLKYKNLLLKVFNTSSYDNSDSVPSLLSEFNDGTSRKELLKEYKALYQQTAQRLENYVEAREHRHEVLTGAASKGDRFDLNAESIMQVALLRMIVENRMNLSMQDWPLSFRPGTYAFQSPGSYSLSPLKSILPVTTRKKLTLTCDGVFAQ